MTDTTTAHHDCGPSSLGRLYDCPGSLWLIRSMRDMGKLPADDSDDAAVGTAIHAWVAAKLTGGDRPELHPDDAEIAERCVGFAFERCGEAMADIGAAELMAERRVHFFDEIGRKVWGTADLIFTEARHAILIDWKTGYLPLDPTHISLQLHAYALGAMTSLPIDSVTCYVYAPRTGERFRDDYNRVDHYDALLASVLQTIVDANAAKPNDLHPSQSACRYCPALAQCPASINHALEVSKRPPALPTDPVRRRELWDAMCEVEKIAKGVRAQLRLDAINGDIQTDGMGVREVNGKSFIAHPGAALTRLEAAGHAIDDDAFINAGSWSLKALAELAGVTTAKLKKEVGDAIEQRAPTQKFEPVEERSE